MKKTLVFADGIVAKIFIQKIITQYFSNNTYVIVCKDSTMFPASIPNSIETHCFDYTSAFRLESVCGSDVQDVFIVIDEPKERFVLYELIRTLNAKVRIVLFNNHEFTTHTIEGNNNVVMLREDLRLKGAIDTNLIVIDSEYLVANRLTQRLANVPLIPRGFGLEQGELMEIAIPPGSIFAYRHIGSIQQKKWRIVGIYRRAEFILATHTLVIQPNDVLLVAGDSVVLSEIYRSAKSDIGQFPAPFGKDIFLYVDTSKSSVQSVLDDIQDALFLHTHIKSDKLHIFVLNPSNFALLESIRSHQAPKIQIHFIYDNSDFCTQIHKDCKKRPGLIVLNHELFIPRKHRQALYQATTPVLKTGYKRLKEVQKGFLVVDEGLQKGENIASVMFDISKQLKITTRFYDFNPDSEHQRTLLGNIENLGKIFSQKPEITYSSSQNPILFLQRSLEVYLQFVPFDSAITQVQLFAFGSMDSQRLSLGLDTNPQIFIPY
ncbi:COG3400 family protein [uncultured Helicobacter sp.]|uniref:COG3400 family protein n=1 Tax=uncultured Helicobacter sp. TaxID=175537 RepID=UPI001C3A65ED|nr:potassium transporter TrkA [Candidatus Helicobacter avicola]